MTQALRRDAVRELDRRAIEEYGVPSILLMENAGRACADEARGLLAGRAPNGPVVVLCGPGNNGGDGLVIARTLFNRGTPVEAWCTVPLERLADASSDVRTNLALYRSLGAPLRAVADAEALAEAAPRLAASPLAVDALFGTGLTRPLEGHQAAVVRALAASGAPVLAVDVPSGLDADTGDVLGAVADAEVTVTFVAPKPGFERGEGPRACGRIVVAEIGIPRPLLDRA